MLDANLDAPMNPFWSQIARELSPYIPGEQPRIAKLVKGPFRTHGLQVIPKT
jgi:hypothetical protein